VIGLGVMRRVHGNDINKLLELSADEEKEDETFAMQFGVFSFSEGWYLVMQVSEEIAFFFLGVIFI